VPLRGGSTDVSAYLSRWPDRAPSARHRSYDLGHLKERTGSVPRFALEDARAETVQWMAAPAG
jgi:hypothetical protein